MLDAALIEKCADPSLSPAIVEQFVEAAGSPDPLAITVKSGGRLILVPKPKTPDEAMEIVRENVGRAIVRVGLTQFPAGVGVKDPSALKPDLVDPCENLKMGTKMFAKIMRIVAKWYGNPTENEVQPRIFEDAVHAWKTGEFEGREVFRAEDPGTDWQVPDVARKTEDAEPADGVAGARDERPAETDTASAGIRIDLSRINGK
ncbi:TraH family protein [Mesorhizobium sp. SP-1A]|uniref:TraH family protein n=1 Tax=Mesorhizobium sp. SP-1A TaxID=3077840 RepID=UPI0028F71EF3|nr:TraH family protein [Mesorhizobium sp. SP-1A]